jgi:Na+/melibiose symporter-like transporter
MITTTRQGYLSFWTKLAYGTGDWSLASFGTLRQVFYAIFLTDEVGLEPRLASFAPLIGSVSLATPTRP